jgi:hypothetical protein
VRSTLVKKQLFGACLCAAAFACSPNHNEDERWEEAAYLPPPSGSLSCEEYAIHRDQFELLGGPGFWDFEAHPNDMTPAPRALNTYTYTDKTAEIFVSNDDAEAAPGSFSYEQPTLTDPTVCHDNGGNHVLRILSQHPFLNWGGGTGRRLQGAEFRVDGGPELRANCGLPSDDDDPICPEENPVLPPEVGESWSAEYYDAIVDLREWEGVSFWARRGERAQPGIRINLADIYVDDDISFIMSGYGVEPYCRRALSCDCSGDRRCVLTTEENMVTPAEYCFTPEDEVTYADYLANLSSESVLPLRLERCGQTKCAAANETFAVADPAFGFSDTEGMDNRQCQPYFFRSDVQSIYNTPDIDHCYDAENGPLPAENYEKCGDNWMHSVYLTTEWKFYRVPFTAFQQQGWAMKSARLDVANLTMIRFTWAAGRVDHYFDDVRFYRRKR